MGSEGRVRAGNRLIAKVSRVEVASKFLAPPPAKFLRALVGSGEITPDQADWASRVPVADDLTASFGNQRHPEVAAGPQGIDQPGFFILSEGQPVDVPDGFVVCVDFLPDHEAHGFDFLIGNDLAALAGEPGYTG